MSALTNELKLFPTNVLLDAVKERLEIIEAENLERECLRPIAAAAMPEVYPRLQNLLAAARAFADKEGAAFAELKALELAIEALDDIVLPGDTEVDSDEDTIPAGDIVELGIQHTQTLQRLTELQKLYNVRLQVTREALGEMKAKMTAAEVK